MKKKVSLPTLKLARKITKVQTQSHIHHIPSTKIKVISLVIHLQVTIIPVHTTHILSIHNYNSNLNLNLNPISILMSSAIPTGKCVQPIWPPSRLTIPLPIPNPNPIWNSLTTWSHTRNGFWFGRYSTPTGTQEKRKGTFQAVDIRGRNGVGLCMGRCFVTSQKS